MRYEKEFEFLRRVTAEAGNLALEHQARGIAAEMKPDDSPVTAADRASEQLICRKLEEEFAADGVLGEEGSKRETRNGRRWIIDPIDGTRDFVRGLPTWGVLVGLEEEGEVVAGACNLAAQGELYSAAKGLGAYRNGARIHCAAEKPPTQAVLCLNAFDSLVGRAFADRLLAWLEQFWAVRSLGGCMDAMSVAGGRADVWIELSAKAWDLAPLKIIAQESGARFFNFNGEASIYGGNCVITIPSIEAEIHKFLAG